MALTWVDTPAMGSESNVFDVREGARVWLRSIRGSDGRYAAKGSAELADGTQATLSSQHDTAAEAMTAGEAWWDGLVPPE